MCGFSQEPLRAASVNTRSAPPEAGREGAGSPTQALFEVQVQAPGPRHAELLLGAGAGCPLEPQTPLSPSWGRGVLGPGAGGLVPPRASLPGPQTASSPLRPQLVFSLCICVPPSREDTSPTASGPTPVASFNYNRLFKDPHLQMQSHSEVLGVRTPACESVSRDVKVKVAQSCPTLRPRGLSGPWDSPGQDTGGGCSSLLQGIFPTQDRTQVSRIAGGFFTG